MPTPTVSVVFSAFQHERFVGEALRSVLAQDVPDLQVVVWEDASTDGTRAVIEAELDRYDGPFDVVRVFNDHNRRFHAFDERIEHAQLQTAGGPT